MPLEVGGLYREDEERFEQAMQAIERIGENLGPGRPLTRKGERASEWNVLAQGVKPPSMSHAVIVVALFRELPANLERRKTVMSRVLDDLSLVQACRAGQTEAFGTLVRRHQDRLYPTILRLIGSAEDAEDVLQDSFVRAFEKLDQFHGESSFYTWIYRIAVNLALQRTSATASSFVGASATKPENCRRRGSAGRVSRSRSDLALERAEREHLVEAALDKLCPEHRAVVILKDFDGHRYEEISEILNVPVGTVRSRLHRAAANFAIVFGVWSNSTNRFARVLLHPARVDKHRADPNEMPATVPDASLFAEDDVNALRR